ncbi:hypothetical protein [Paenarthrobacter sp. YJN-5]|uniref:hypothetical protein n=1 Tax=Paenarthrobacter sp. YJN-5 TaxID=2735316 RepID=UPI001877D6E0|nr:hypothetical protein [Paenarthrobacter sp. YJN-5]QOT19564.1 hypothetical protein HMI59_23350 [Paenarthrobacter sp. YJN-5]
MTDHITIRETLEYTVPLQGWENGDYSHLTHLDATSTKSVLREIIDRRHEPDYVISLDDDRQVHILLADGAEVFAHRSHDSVINHFRELTGYTGHLELFGDLEDTDKSWNGM